MTSASPPSPPIIELLGTDCELMFGYWERHTLNTFREMIFKKLMD